MIPDLPPLRDVIALHQLTARKSLGQNYILDMNLNRKIARQAALTAGDVVLEIGAGPGGLTRALLETDAAMIVAVEIDRRFAPALALLAAAYGPRFAFHTTDGLQFCQENTLAVPHHVVANLPYNVATRFLIHWLSSPAWPPAWQSLVITLQREVAGRLMAPPASSLYGRLSVLAQLRAQVTSPMTLPPDAFTPMPAVSSTVVRITPGDEPIPPSMLPALVEVTRLAFQQRRKMIRSSLRHLFADPAGELTALGLDPSCRAQDLDIEAYCHIARHAHAAGRPPTIIPDDDRQTR
ncbi:MAG: 16S rRNA (adenine(1518)-N(6)/adenine(1519)-N(6))-dimethyltransferase RsmA [Rhodobacteraceae bacterium]|nr:16S rRNA (adenine(1518)-N(6)/adenine(1519)-N(6))-dimethyltransferase RsmA [Paracoccaceae bacterium]